MRNDMATLEQFLKTGELGPIRPGMSRADIVDCLGPPQDESVARNPLILKYGGVQLTFLTRPDEQDQVLAHIGLYFAPHSEPVPEPIRPVDFTLTHELTIDELRDFLVNKGLSAFSEVEEEDTRYMVLPSGVRITFDGPKLHSIIFAARKATAASKQVSVSVPGEMWKQLRWLAQESKQSVSELCAQWIRERVNGAGLRNGGVSPLASPKVQ